MPSQGFGPPVPAGPAPYAPQGPEFIAHDKKNSVIVDPQGVALEVGGHLMEFPWQDAAAVHFAPAPWGTILMVAVVHRSGTTYECRVQAKKQSVLHRWLGEMAPVVHHYLANRPPVH
ncbi:hypothetical protein I3F58_16215 [Streptomyces sp. MUM 203J]|uniref:hypothetical protein n=1 Tax=Streptomyces sp. MUM 203J TaxID=2791990 RepID=UPI001F03A341|nr:hypothetical protein [Streptomyces sp. MUM 203J]MCH0541084.1 hypothetical protein [Streptomyces sp. MUM 203J]